MKNGLTELVFVLDRSGSMSGLESDTIGGFNAMLEKQRKESGDAVVTTVLFDDRYEILHDRISLKGVRPMTASDYFVRGCTALLDAVGKTVEKIDRAQNHTAESEKAEKVLMVITTDGLENASKEYSVCQIREMIRQKKEKNGWEFLFLGANMDAVAEAKKLGIDEDRAASFLSDREGTQVNYAAMSKAVAEFRNCCAVPSDWKKSIENDFRARRKT